MAVFAEEGVGCAGLLWLLFVLIGRVGAFLPCFGTFFGVVIVSRLFVFTLLGGSLGFYFLNFNIFVVLPLALFVFMFFGLVSFVEVLCL